MKPNLKCDFDTLLDELGVAVSKREAATDAVDFAKSLQASADRHAKNMLAAKKAVTAMVKANAVHQRETAAKDAVRRVDDARALYHDIVAKADAAVARGELTSLQASWLDSALPKFGARLGIGIGR